MTPHLRHGLLPIRERRSHMLKPRTADCATSSARTRRELLRGGSVAMTDKILVPVDGSELSDRILVHVSRLLMRTDAEVTILRAVPLAAGLEQQTREDAPARRQVDELAAQLRANGANARGLVVRGDPAELILATASELRPSLIAMSTHGRSGVSRFVRGSVAERVLRHSSVPVLLANPLAL